MTGVEAKFRLKMRKGTSWTSMQTGAIKSNSKKRQFFVLNDLRRKSRRQSYKRNFVLKKTKFILNSLTVRYVDLDWATFKITYLKQCAFYDFKTNLIFSKTNFLL